MEPTIDPRLIGWHVAAQEMSAMENAGSVIAPVVGRRVEFTTRGRFTVYVPGAKWPDHYGCRTDAAVEPHTIRFFIMSTNTYTYGIYRFEDEELVVCVSAYGVPAPTAFSLELSGRVLSRYRRTTAVRRKKKQRVRSGDLPPLGTFIPEELIKDLI